METTHTVNLALFSPYKQLKGTEKNKKKINKWNNDFYSGDSMFQLWNRQVFPWSTRKPHWTSTEVLRVQCPQNTILNHFAENVRLGTFLYLQEPEVM